MDDSPRAGPPAGIKEMVVERPTQQLACGSDWPEMGCSRADKAHMPAPVPPEQPCAASVKAQGSKRRRLVLDLGPTGPQAVHRVAEAADQQSGRHSANVQLTVLPHQQMGKSLEGTAGVSMEQLNRQEPLNSSQAIRAAVTSTGVQQPETCPALQKPVMQPRVRKFLFQSTSTGRQENVAGAASHQPDQLATPHQQVGSQSQKEQEPCKGQINVEGLKTASGAGPLADMTEKLVMQPDVRSVFFFL